MIESRTLLSALSCTGHTIGPILPQGRDTIGCPNVFHGLVNAS